MWHVSVYRPSRFVDFLEKVARDVLHGFGDSSLGEWRELGTAFHLRRRLSAKEQESVGPALDARATPVATARSLAATRWMPPNLRYMIEEEIG